MLILFYNFANVLNVSWGNKFFSLENSVLSCPCFDWSFIGIFEYCLFFSGVCEEKNHAHNDRTGLFLKLYLRWFQNELDKWKEKFSKTCLAQSHYMVYVLIEMHHWMQKGSIAHLYFTLLSTFLLVMTRDRRVYLLNFISSISFSTFNCG